MKYENKIDTEQDIKLILNLKMKKLLQRIIISNQSTISCIYKLCGFFNKLCIVSVRILDIYFEINFV